MVTEPDGIILYQGRIVLFSDGSANVVSPVIVLFHSGVPFGGDVGMASESETCELPRERSWKGGGGGG